jgi:membrane-associated phospholipid phosphatase
MAMQAADQGTAQASDRVVAAQGSTWSRAIALFRREQPFCQPLVILFMIIPFYMVIGWEYAPYVAQHAPVTALDSLFPLSPPWAVVYASLFLAALLPAFVLHDTVLFRRTVIAYIIAWLVAYAFFLAWPTVCPRPAKVEGGGFSEWLLRNVYGTDHRYNCFPSLHVAQCFIAALACRFVHRRFGDVLLVWAALVAMSTIYTKQHYVADAISGAMLGAVSVAIAFRGYDARAIAQDVRALAPALGSAAFAAYGLFVAAAFVAYVT